MIRWFLNNVQEELLVYFGNVLAAYGIILLNIDFITKILLITPSRMFKVNKYPEPVYQDVNTDDLVL